VSKRHAEFVENLRREETNRPLRSSSVFILAEEEGGGMGTRSQVGGARDRRFVRDSVAELMHYEE